MKKILFAGSEAMPFGATGGLGDVLGALPPALAAVHPDWDVRVVMPLYAQVGAEWREKMTFEKSIRVTLAWREQYCGIFSLDHKGVKYYFIDNEYYFKRNALYGFFDDAERFAFFSRAVLDLMDVMDFFPDVLHANDWQTALSVIVLKEERSHMAGYKDVKAVYTIHNIDYQGVYSLGILNDVFGMSEEKASIVEYSGALNLTKGAIVCADFVTTVSPQYSKEIQTEFFSHGLHHIINQYGFKIGGIINGIDEAAYDPRTDGDIPATFSAESLGGKKADKEALQREFGLEIRPDVPVIAMVSRLAEHKGFDLVCSIADELMNDDVQFVLLGTGDAGFEAFFEDFGARHPGKAGIRLAYNRKLSKLIYAGADMFLMPSKSEACGLAQMIASRYGTVPIVRETGGLYDTIKPYSWDRSGNGFTFAAYNAYDMLYVIREAEGVYRDKENWEKLVAKIMKIDFSWNTSAGKYAALYERVSQG
ncbi:MAG: glycogen synthase GlgA [Clostridia bacterium]|nr:glycogen synthase GlgA [Clostridia bacterium]